MRDVDSTGAGSGAPAIDELEELERALELPVADLAALQRLVIERDGVDFAEKHGLADDRYAPSGGAFPLRVRGVGSIGGVVVSGLPQVEDHAFVLRVVADHLRAS
jgi:uncharacterized protein (UPF0303 family)